MSSDRSGIAELMSIKEFRNDIVSKMVISLEVSYISTDIVGLFGNHDLLL